MASTGRWTTPLVAGIAGGAFFLWIAGARSIDPTEIAWTMQLDWRIHFMGWHFFRGEPWHWPPGVIEGYYHAPDGTAIGFTDSIPLVAFVLKPIAKLLPMPFQYLGVWMLICFVLQGVFGVLLTRRWTTNAVLQLLGAAFFILMPTLLIRVGHPSLCSHWLLLWALWLYLNSVGSPFDSHALAQGKRPTAHRSTNGRRGMGWIAQHAALGLCAGLLHPYLAVMVIAILGARAVRDRQALPLAACVVCVAAGWWAAGLFTVSGPANLTSEGLGNYSMNLLSPVMPSSPGWSTFLSLLPTAMPGQAYEGFQYFGAGVLAIFALAFALAIRHHSTLSWRPVMPLLAVSIVFALYALSPLVTFGSSVVVDARGPWTDRFAVFRATGRFFWPMSYLLLISAIALIVTRLPFRVALAVLTGALVVQMMDLRTAHAERRAASRSDAFHGWRNPLAHPAWHKALPHYRHLALVPPRECGSAVIGFEGPALLAGMHGVTLNSGEVARLDENKRRRYCEELSSTLNAGQFADDTLYLMDQPVADHLKLVAKTPLVCGPMDVVWVCATARSYEPWRAAARLE